MIPLSLLLGLFRGYLDLNKEDTFHLSPLLFKIKGI